VDQLARKLRRYFEMTSLGTCAAISVPVVATEVEEKIRATSGTLPIGRRDEKGFFLGRIQHGDLAGRNGGL
jgi:hypothetical protein